MCTVSFLPRHDGYVLAMNRDEKLSRVAGLTPHVQRFQSGAALFPSEPGGGTWIGLNDSGISLALINWYSVPQRTDGPLVSRGTIVHHSLVAHTRRELDALLSTLPLERIKPFRLIAVFPHHKQLVEFHGATGRLHSRELAWEFQAWFSSAFDEPGAQTTRAEVFCRELGRTKRGDEEVLRRVHRSHLPARGAYSICMHRSDAATVSYTEIVVAGGRGSMRYVPGPPCSHSLAFIRHLALPHRRHGASEAETAGAPAVSMEHDPAPVDAARCL